MKSVSLKIQTKHKVLEQRMKKKVTKKHEEWRAKNMAVEKCTE